MKTKPTNRLTLDELIKKFNPCRARPSDEEHNIQTQCVEWFNTEFPNLKGRLFAVPNGGRRDKRTAAKLKAEGVVAGVSDLILLLPNKSYGALLIELKTPKGRQSPSQREWQRLITYKDEYQYIVVRSADEFKHAIHLYINNN